MLDDQPLGEYPELEPLHSPYIGGQIESLQIWGSPGISVGGAGRAEVFGPYFYRHWD